MKTLSYLNAAFTILFVICTFYQFVFAWLRLRRKGRTFKAQKLCRYAALIPARNEEAVIGQLIDSIRAQDYPQDLLDIYIVADNCTDSTAKTAREHGAIVYERKNREQVGKGYALEFLLSKIRGSGDHPDYDGYFVFDADNLLDPHYVTEMNKVFSSGNRVVTGYRNTKNFGDNWVTAGYGLWFLRESEYLNRPRDYLGFSCAVSGTGFLFAESLLQEIGGWNYYLLTEDLEFTAAMAAKGEKIAYCGSAILYDEQPASFRLSIVQRSRWVKGYLQVVSKQGGNLARGLFSAGNFACYDMLMNSIPAVALTLSSTAINLAMLLIGLLWAPKDLFLFFICAGGAIVGSYSLMYVMGVMPLITEWKRIRCSRKKKILYSFTFPFFMFSFGIAMLAAVFGGGQWKPIRHTVALSIGDMEGTPKE